MVEEIGGGGDHENESGEAQFDCHRNEQETVGGPPESPGGSADAATHEGVHALSEHDGQERSARSRHQHAGARELAAGAPAGHDEHDTKAAISMVASTGPRTPKARTATVRFSRRPRHRGFLHHLR